MGERGMRTLEKARIPGDAVNCDIWFSSGFFHGHKFIIRSASEAAL